MTDCTLDVPSTVHVDANHDDSDELGFMSDRLCSERNGMRVDEVTLGQHDQNHRLSEGCTFRIRHCKFVSLACEHAALVN